jgi:hypothetical protein
MEVFIQNATVYTHFLGLKKAVGLTDFVATGFNPLAWEYSVFGVQ